MLEFSSSNGLFVSWASEISSNQAPLLTGAVFSLTFQTHWFLVTTFRAIITMWHIKPGISPLFHF